MSTLDIGLSNNMSNIGSFGTSLTNMMSIMFMSGNKNNTFYDIIRSVLFIWLTSTLNDKTSLMMRSLSIIFHFIMINVTKIFSFIKYKIFGKKKNIIKHVEISYITTNKTINELYKAVNWYLSNNDKINFIIETPLKYVFDKKLNTKESIIDEPINKFVLENREKKIEYKNYIINYTLTNELVTIYTDKETQKENHKIYLNVKINSDTSFDILEDFCRFCMQEYVKSLTSAIWKQKIYTHDNETWIENKSNNKRSMETIILQNGLKEEIVSDLKIFLNSEDWYHQRDIPYTRGYLFYGPPGTGKTSMIKGIANLCKRHIHYLMLNNIRSDMQLLKLLEKINFSETIVVIEDIDCISKIVMDRNLQQNEQTVKEEIINKTIDSLKNMYDSIDDNDLVGKIVNSQNLQNVNRQLKNQNCNTTTHSLTLSGILNALDGIFTNENRILIMTSNNPKILDKAIIRPGRIDRQFLFDNATEKQITELFEMFFNIKFPSNFMGLKDNIYSPAAITSLFMRYRNSPLDALKHLDELDTKL